MFRGLIDFAMISKVCDVPYGDFFENHERWLVLSNFNSSRKCILRAIDKIVFVKSTLFESRIKTRTKEDMVKYFKEWECMARERGFF